MNQFIVYCLLSIVSNRQPGGLCRLTKTGHNLLHRAKVSICVSAQEQS